MSVAVGTAQPRQFSGWGKLIGHEDQRRHEHAAEGGNQGKHAARPGVELALNHLPFDLETHQQKEEGHQPIVDPMQEIEAGDARMQRFSIRVPEDRIGHGQRERGAAHEQNAARSFGTR